MIWTTAAQALSFLALVWLWPTRTATTTVSAWIIVPRRPPAVSSSTRWRASLDETSTRSSTKPLGRPLLSPEFKTACTNAQEQLRDLIPLKYHDKFLPLLDLFVAEYMTACSHNPTTAGDPVSAAEGAARRILQCIQYSLQFGGMGGSAKYQFDVSHVALRGQDSAAENGNTVDYYAFGNDFLRPCMDLEHSIVAGRGHLDRAMQQIAAGDNVVLLANHQSEADPQVVSCLLEMAGYEQQAADLVYVAGHKVTTDPLAIPFSMGRSLLCIHSKKHINSDPDTKPDKQRQNLKAMSILLAAFKKGGCLLWVAPSGGRDRLNVDTDEVPLAAFDRKTIDMFRLMGNKSGVPTHYYTLAMVSYDLCPPPDFVDPGVGEARHIRFVPVGIQMGEELPSEGGLERRDEFRDHAMEQCQADYAELQRALRENK